MRAMEMRAIFLAAGGVSKLARAVGRDHSTLLGWQRVPPIHVRAVAQATGLPPHQLRPDLFDPSGQPAPSQQERAA